MHVMLSTLSNPNPVVRRHLQYLRIYSNLISTTPFISAQIWDSITVRLIPSSRAGTGQTP